MFLPFFYLLRAKGLKISITDWMTFIEGIEKDLHLCTFSGFYTLCRAVLVKSEADFDIFDEAFCEYFQGIDKETAVSEEIKSWLDKPELEKQVFSRRYMEERKATKEEIERLFAKRLEDQREEHNGGCMWIGTSGHTAYGHHGKDLGGIRVSGSGQMSSAYRVATERKYRDWRRDNTLDSRQFQIAFRNLRQLSNHSIQAKTELDVDATIQKTCENGGNLKIVRKTPRKNVIKLLLLIDSGGSMEPYQRLCSMLFQSVSKAGSFDDLKIYYFHNCLGKFLFESPDMRWDKTVPTDWVIQNLDETYRVIFVGDAEMAPDELFSAERRIGDEQIAKNAYIRFQEVKQKFAHIIWLHPQEPPRLSGYWTRSFFLLSDLFTMYRLTLGGLTAGVKYLLSHR